MVLAEKTFKASSGEVPSRAPCMLQHFELRRMRLRCIGEGWEQLLPSEAGQTRRGIHIPMKKRVARFFFHSLYLGGVGMYSKQHLMVVGVDCYAAVVTALARSIESRIRARDERGSKKKWKRKKEERGVGAPI